jgi:hypothetical protein
MALSLIAGAKPNILHVDIQIKKAEPFLTGDTMALSLIAGAKPNILHVDIQIKKAEPFLTLPFVRKKRSCQLFLALLQDENDVLTANWSATFIL